MLNLARANQLEACDRRRNILVLFFYFFLFGSFSLTVHHEAREHCVRQAISQFPANLLRIIAPPRSRVHMWIGLLIATVVGMKDDRV